MRARTGLTAAIAGALIWAGSAEAKTFEVTRANDPGPGNCKRNDCSLREAVRAANARPGRDVVLLRNRKKPYSLSRAGTGEDGALTGDLDITNDALTIEHRGRGTATVDAQGIDRAFEAFDQAPVRFVKVRITGGNDTSGNGGGGLRTDANATLVKSVVSGNSSSDIGGGIDADLDADLVITRSRFNGNTSDETGGGIASSVDGRLTLKRSRVTGNDAQDAAGGVQVISAVGALIKQSTIAGNEAVDSSGGIHAVVNTTPSTIRIVESTISGNTAGFDGGGLTVAEGHDVRLVNSTIAGNEANDNGGGIATFDGSTVSLNAVTVARNSSGADDPGPAPTTGGGIYMIDSTFEVENSLIGLNTIGIGGIQRNDCEGETFASLGNNLVSDDTECDGFTATGDITNVSPKLDKLARNGGPTKTAALRKGSQAIGKARRSSAPNRDQRGRKRDAKPDIGAFERGA